MRSVYVEIAEYKFMYAYNMCVEEYLWIRFRAAPRGYNISASAIAHDWTAK